MYRKEPRREWLTTVRKLSTADTRSNLYDRSCADRNPAGLEATGQLNRDIDRNREATAPPACLIESGHRDHNLHDGSLPGGRSVEIVIVMVLMVLVAEPTFALRLRWSAASLQRFVSPLFVYKCRRRDQGKIDLAPWL